MAGLTIGDDTQFHKKDSKITVIEWIGDEALVTGATDGAICMVIATEGLKHLKVA